MKLSNLLRSGGPNGSQIPAIVGGLVVGALAMGAIAPLVGTDRSTSATSGAAFELGAEAGDASDGGLSSASSDGDDLAIPGADSAGSAGGAGSQAASGLAAGAAGPAGTAATGQTGSVGADSGGDDAGPAVERTASDVGVTEDTIRIGIMNLDCKGCAAFGFRTDDVASQRQMAQAFVDDINERGGIAGRRLELHAANYDPVQDAIRGGGTYRAGCIELTENKKVFAMVFSSVGGEADMSCFTEEHETPAISFLTGSPDPEAFARSGGRLWGLSASSARLLTDWAVQLDQQGLLRRGTKWGLVHDEEENPTVSRYLQAELERRGLKPARVTVLPLDPSAATVKIAQEVPAMQAAGITHVVFATNFVNGASWVRESQRNGYRPQYLLGDYVSPADDFSGGQYASGGDSFRGAIAISSAAELTPAELDADAAAASCFAVFAQQLGRDPGDGEEKANVLPVCSAIRRFEDAMRRAGPNPTRQSWVQAMAATGEFPLPGFLGGKGSFGGRYAFGQTKWTAVDFGQRKVWTSPCPRQGDDDGQCWVPQGPIHRMAT